MSASNEYFPDKKDPTLKNADLGGEPASAASMSSFTEHFAPPPNYPEGESYELGSFQPRGTGTSGATGSFGHSDAPRAVVEPRATEAPAAAPEEPFDFSFYAPRKSKKWYWIALIAIIFLVIAGLTALSGTLALKLSTQPKPHTITVTMAVTTTQQLSFTTTTILTTNPMPTSIIATKTELPVGKPKPSPTLADSPHATCIAVDRQGGGADVRIWENYIASYLQETELAVALDEHCGLNLQATGWTITQSDLLFPLPGNKVWVAKSVHTVVLPNLTLPDGLQCVRRAIIDAGGPADTPICSEQQL